MDKREKTMVEAVKEEDRRLRHLKFIVNLTMSVIAQSDLSLEEASKMVASTREVALRLFPGKETAYDLIYKPRLQRLLNEKYRLH